MLCGAVYARLGTPRRLIIAAHSLICIKLPLKQQELLELGGVLRRIHEISYRWDAQTAVSNALISEMCQKQEEMVLSEVRLFIKQMIRGLDMAEQGHSMDGFNLAENLLNSQKETEQEKLQRLEPAWDAHGAVLKTRY